jgi:carboxyl-terminal processing protease
MLLWLALALPARAEEPVTAPTGATGALRQFTGIIDALQQHYIDPKQIHLNERATIAFRELVRSLDPEADLLTPAEYAAANALPDEQTGDVGLALAARGGLIVVIAARDGSPAQAAGLFAGDELVALDGNSTSQMRVVAVRRALRGPVFSPVRLQFRNTQEIVLPRVAITTNLPSSTLKFLRPGIAYCRVAQFTEPARERLELDLAAAVQGKARHLILDLRSNAGGSFDTALRMARLFLSHGSPIVALGYAQPEQLSGFNTDTPPKFVPPLTVLVNGGTAGEAEILAAALRDNQRARLVGSRTFGYGWHNGMFPLPDGSALLIPTARYLTPTKRTFHDIGLTPDVVVDIARETERDLARAGFGSFEWGNDGAAALQADRALARALELIAH